MSDTISGSIERITYHNEENGYVVLRVKVPGRRDLQTVVGYLTTVVAGEYIEASGEWIQDRTHGLQFKAESIHSAPPHSAAGILKYLSSGLVKGIGPVYAKKIVEHFGDDTLKVIDETPTHLSEVKGIGAKRLQRIRQSWVEQKGVRRIMVFLQSNGVGTARAVRIYKTYGENAVEMVRENPYRLTADVWGFGFKTADELALRLGTPPDSEHRARAAVRYALQEFATRGHVGFPMTGVIEKAREVTQSQVPEEVIQQAIETGRAEGEFVRDVPPPSVPDVDPEPWLFTKPLFLAELGVARSVCQLLEGSHPLPALDIETACELAERKLNLTLADGQRDAILAAMREKMVIITGGPGTGKTSLVRGIIEIFAANRQRIALCAPTGRAAKRLSESTGREAKTIHRLLEFDPQAGGFQRSAESPLDVDLLVCDETSMVDVVLMNQLLRAVPKWACVVLVGDVDQLPSVGPGSVLGDLIKSERIPVVRLSHIFRQAEESWIIRAAHAVNHGEQPASAPPGGDGDFYFIEADEPAVILDRIVTMIRDRMPSRFGLDPFRDIQVLSPGKKSEIGVVNLNAILQNALNPGSVELTRGGVHYRVGDKVLQVVNNYQREVFNGDIGRIEKIDDNEQLVSVNFDGRIAEYEFGEMDELMLAYACTVHKSQGSEYPAVIVPLSTQHYTQLRRNLLYTAITRGKRLVVVVGSRKALHLALTQTETDTRFSLLRWRLDDDQPEPSD